MKTTRSEYMTLTMFVLALTAGAISSVLIGSSVPIICALAAACYIQQDNEQ